MYKFFQEQNGKILPNPNKGTELICDAFTFVLRQEPGTPGMTVLARTGTATSLFGRPRGESIDKSWQFTKKDAIATAVFAAEQISRFVPDDSRVTRAIAAAKGEDEDALVAAMNSSGLAASEARGAGNEAAAFGAESARAAAIAALAPDAGVALHSAAYSVAYAIQGAYKAGTGDEMETTIEKWLHWGLAQLGRV